MRRNNYEDELSYATADYLDHQPWLYTHFPAGEYRPPRVGAKLKKMGLKPGFPDYLIFDPRPRGCMGLALELKSPKGVLNANQKIVRPQLEAAGWLYIVCRTIDEVIDACSVLR